MIDLGSGPPLVLVPGLQGRWEWMYPAVEALSRSFRVLSFTLAGDWSSRQRFEDRLGFDNFVVQIDRVLEEKGLRSAIVCGVSYGGLIALRYAARRPERVRTLVLASALPPDFVPDERYHFYKRAPMLLFPVFLAGSTRRVSPEIRAALPGWRERLEVSVRHGWRVLAAPTSPLHMRRRMELLADQDFEADARNVQAPTLLLTGEPGLDRTVPVELSLHYTECIPGCRHVVLDRTGHLGTVTRPDGFAASIKTFVDGVGDTRARRTRVAV